MIPFILFDDRTLLKIIYEIDEKETLKEEKWLTSILPIDMFMSSYFTT